MKQKLVWKKQWRTKTEEVAIVRIPILSEYSELMDKAIDEGVVTLEAVGYNWIRGGKVTDYLEFSVVRNDSLVMRPMTYDKDE